MVRADLGGEAHTAIASRLRRDFNNVAALQDTYVLSCPSRQFHLDDEIADLDTMLDEPPSGVSLFVDPIQNSATDVMSVRPQEPGALAGQAVSDGQTPFVQKSAFDLSQQPVHVLVLPQSEQLTRYRLFATAIQRGELRSVGKT